jgi:hypothetical protein
MVSIDALFDWVQNVLVMTLQGNRDNIDSMAGGSQKVLTQVLEPTWLVPWLAVCRHEGPQWFSAL